MARECMYTIHGYDASLFAAASSLVHTHITYVDGITFRCTCQFFEKRINPKFVFRKRGIWRWQTRHRIWVGHVE